MIISHLPTKERKKERERNYTALAQIAHPPPQE